MPDANNAFRLAWSGEGVIARVSENVLRLTRTAHSKGAGEVRDMHYDGKNFFPGLSCYLVDATAWGGAAPASGVPIVFGCGP